MRRPAPRQGYYADGGIPGGPLAADAGAGAVAGSDELVRAVQGVERAVRALPSRQRIAWDGEDTANVETALEERQEVRNTTGIR